MHIEKRTRAGTTITVEQYRKVDAGKGDRETREGGTTKAQRECNLRRAVKRLMWLMNANFRDGDLLVTLDYRKSERPESTERMNKDAVNFLNKVKRRLKKLYGKKAVLKYIRVVEIGSKGARHHHMLLPYMELWILKESWDKGGIDVKPLYSDGNYRKIAEYFVKYARKKENGEETDIRKLWYPSRGLKRVKDGKPKVISSRKVGKVRIPKGWYLDQESVRQGMSEYDGYETFFCVLVKLEKRKKKGREGR